MYYFSADEHFGHSRIIEYCHRDYPDVNSMNEDYIKRWNKKVGEGDTVISLGDFTLGPPEYAQSILEELNGRVVILDTGVEHHDSRWLVHKHIRDGFYFARIKKDGYDLIRTRDGPIVIAPPVVDFHFNPVSALGSLVGAHYLDSVTDKRAAKRIHVIACHCPFEEWIGKYYGYLHVHGHSHGRSRYMPNRFDVGVDAIGLIVGGPVSLDHLVHMSLSQKEAKDEL